MKTVILDLCGGTGSWSKPYREAGFEVHNITLPDYDILQTEFSRDAIHFYGQKRCIVNYDRIYGIFAAPPCTMFSTARTTAATPRDLAAGMEVVEKCMEIIWKVRKIEKIHFWALENPRGILRQFLGIPTLSYQPDEYGELYTKHTDIWGYFTTPTKLKVKPVIPDRVKKQLAKNNRILPKLPEGYSEPGRRNQAARRAMTSPKFAEAFFKANHA